MFLFIYLFNGAINNSDYVASNDMTISEQWTRNDAHENGCVRLLFVLFCVLFVCKCVLPPGDNPIAVNKYIINLKCGSSFCPEISSKTTMNLRTADFWTEVETRETSNTGHIS
jgi:hypothetical protein